MRPKLPQGMLVAALGSVASPAAGFLSAPLLARSLGVVGRGSVAAAVAPLTLASSVLTIGLPEAATYFIARNPAAARIVAKRAILWSIVAGLAGCVAIALAAPALAKGDRVLSHQVALVGLATAPMLALGVLRGAAAGHHQWRLVGWEGLFTSLLRLVALAILALTGTLTVSAAIIVIVGSNLAGFVVYIRLFANGGLGAHDVAPGEAGLKDTAVLGYGLGMWIGSVSGVLLTTLGQALMTPLSSAVQLGYYAVALSIVQAITVINDLIKKVTFSVEASDPNDERLARASRVSTIATALACLVVGAATPVVVPILFGRAFAPSIPLIEVLLVALVLFTPGSIAGAGMMARGRPVLRSLCLTGAAVVNLVLLILLVPRHGALGAAVAMLVSQPLAGMSFIFMLRIFFDVPVRSFFAFRLSDLHDLRHLVASALTSRA